MDRNLIIEKSILGTEKGWELIFDAIPDLIAILDTDHRIVKVNRAMADKVSKSPNTLIGTVCYKVVHNTEIPPENCPHSKLLKDGLEHTWEVYEENLGGYYIVTASPIRDNNGNLIGSIHIAHDITKRKEVEEKLEKTLQEKDILMKEIYHRVKNNLMVISGLLSLQSRYIKDDATKQIFMESQNRAKSMALIHEKLYKSKDLKHLNFTEYLQNLSYDLYNTYTYDKSIVKLVLDVDDVIFDVEISIPLGLILNELLTNSLKHAFPEGKSGEIKVELHLEDDGRYKLSVEDNGIGFPKDLNFKKTGTLGMQIINSLTDQIEGEIVLDTDNGTKFTIFFNDTTNN